MPTPGATPEFLATLEGLGSSVIPSDLPDKLIIENYTRDPWAWKPNPSVWQSFQTKSVDGRNKLPGFLKYLKDRTKSAFGRFADKESIVVISYIQKVAPSGSPPQLECRLAWDLSSVPGCPMKPPPPKPIPAAVLANVQKPPAKKIPPKHNVRQRKGGGLLGNLVASANRTVAAVQKDKAKPKADTVADGSSSGASNKKSAQQVMAEFRQKMSEKMLDFDISSEGVLRVSINPSEYHKDLATLADKAKITMEILKYMVYESVEEVNEDWIAHKEPSEFMDEATIAVYKEGEAPAEVLEEVNKGELPDEIRGQQRAMQAEQQKQAEMKEKSMAQKKARQALAERAADDDDTEVLNQNKRDRRTVAEYQEEQKRARTD